MPPLPRPRPLASLHYPVITSSSSSVTTSSTAAARMHIHSITTFHPAQRPTASPSSSPASLLSNSSATSSPPQLLRAFTTSPARPSDSHNSHYDPPSGWLWGIPPGQKREKEGWENIWFWGFYGSLGLAVIGYAYKPDSSIETWALEEAKRRLQAEGTLPEDE